MTSRRRTRSLLPIDTVGFRGKGMREPIAFLLGVLLSACACAAESEIDDARPPNVLIIMADDLGYNDLSCYGSQKMKTPVLDKMAREGIRLTGFYAGATVCTPSRMALLSGAYPARIGWEGGVLGYGMQSFTGLSPEVATIAEVFREAGYRTAVSGKWHVGTGEMLPMHQGFDETYYVVSSNNLTKKLFRGDELVADPFDNRRLTERFTQEAIRFIRGHQNAPFFLYLPYTAPHFPAEAHPDWDGRSINGAYGDVVEEMDDRIGEILDALKENKIDDDTIVVFLSDNGPEPGQSKFSSASPWSGRKWSAREGGTRVPCIVRWPGVIKAGQESDEVIAAIDLFPTLAHACGVEIDMPEGAQKFDGVNVWDTLLGKDTTHARKELLYWQGWGVAQAIRVGDWKLHFGQEKGLPGAAPEIPGTDQGPALFNLRDDPSESVNLSDRHPGKVQELLALARTRLEDVHRNYTRIGMKRHAPSPIEDWKPQRKWGKWLTAR